MFRWSSNWQNLASQKFDRHGQQNSYDHDTLVKGQKVIESLLGNPSSRNKSVDFGIVNLRLSDKKDKT